MPSLLEKMYEDGKYAAKERNKAKEKMKKKEEAIKKKKLEQEKRKKKKKKKEDRKLSTNEKIAITILLVILVPVCVILFIYYQSSLLDAILLATVNGASKNLNMPDDPDKLPYSKPNSKKDPTKHPSNNKSVFEIIDEDKKNRSPVLKGGNKESFNKAVNEAKGFTDPTKWGWPYSWIENENPIMSSIGNYFATFFITIRSVFLKYLQLLNDTFGEELKKQPSTMFDKVKDFALFAFVLPICNQILHLAQYIVAGGAMIWASINNQNLFMIFWLAVAFCCIVFGWLQTPQYFWPFQFVAFYLTMFMLKYKPAKMEIFRTYGKRYKLCWAALIILILFISISALWDWHPTAMIASGAVPFGMLFLTAIGFAASV